ncbi:MAG: transglutaminase domain-containing protein [Candidatus Limivivens sp.]|nr:transglutaminase domain-containing protein [Candidatus Limivivens sp.]
MFLEKSRDRIEKDFERLCRHQPEIMGQIREQLEGCSPETALALKYLYCTMPCSDMGNYGFPVFYDYAAHGVMLWETYEYVRKLPEELFLNYVLYHRVNEEEIDLCRSFFYEKIREYGREMGLVRSESEPGDSENAADWLAERAVSDIALEINFWCAGEATYQASDSRTASARTVYESCRGRCGEESVFTVNAMRSAGIPARQVYAPRWSHCDDNHAWVEVWLDGEWYFLGACEPEPDLNHGWFNGASSRAMMVHSRWFDSVPPAKEQVIGQDGIVTVENQLRRYAETTEIEVLATDQEGTPVKGAVVSFQVLNYGEFFPVAEMVTDREGRVRLETGLGSLHLDVRCGEKRGELQIDTRKETSCTCVLCDEVRLEEGWTDFDMYAPSDRIGSGRKMTDEEKAAYEKKLAKVTGKRLQKARRWQNPEREKFFYGDIKTASWRAKLLEALSEKDQLDLKAEVLEEHLQEALPYAKDFPEEIFVPYVLSPRIWDEVLMPWRKTIREAFSSREESFRQDPKRIWAEITACVREHDGRERSSIFTTPAAALKLGVANLRSRKVLFVAVARTFGIPARINPENQAVEYWKDGAFVPVLDEERKTAKLILCQDPEGTVWKYYQNWTLAKLENGTYHTLRLENYQWENGELTAALVPGIYRLLTANRLPNGNIFGKRFDFSIGGNETKKIRMEFRKAQLSDILSHISLPEFTVKDRAGSTRTGSELALGGKTLFIWLEESKEPTEHILNELMERREEFRNCTDQIALMIRSEKALADPTLSRCMEALPGIPVYFHDFGKDAEVLARRVYTEPGRWPLILVAENQESGLTALYGTSGYNVGTGDMVLRILNS